MTQNLHPSKPQSEELRLKMEQILLLEKKLKHQEGLPHLFAHKFYKWQRDFFECRHQMAMLTAANQIGKSTIQIKRTIEWATNKTLWRELWPKLGPNDVPNLFWYFYPSKPLATVEFKTKWMPLLPRGEYKNHPVYGWKETYKNGLIDTLQFNSGVLVVFKVYAQDASDLQAGTVYNVACDEELPYELYGELSARTQACDGYFSMVFTATLGQEHWRKAMEPREDEQPLYPRAWKRQISLYDCMFYEDGSQGQYDQDKINSAIARCGTQNEILKRVHGKFVVAGGRVYESFDEATMMKDPHPIPKGWRRYAGIDSGSGDPGNGENQDKTDPAAIIFVAVSPDYRQARVYKAWRGDDQLTTSSDIVNKYLEMRGYDNIEMTTYDYSDKDLHTIATRMGLGFVRADKARDRGEGILNTLFKNNFLYLYRDGEISKLASELSNLKKGSRKPVDHLCDALRYACVSVPWDFSIIGRLSEKPPEVPKPKTQAEMMAEELAERRGISRRYERGEYDEGWNSVEDEIQEFNELTGG